MAREAGFRATSGVSVLAGVLVAHGAVLLLLGAVAGVASAIGLDTDRLDDDEWHDVGTVAAIVVGIVLLVSYTFGGYVAGRMGRRAGLTHGLLVFLLGVVVLAVAAGATALGAGGDAIGDGLRDRGVPTEADDWRSLGLFAGLGLLAAMLLGAIVGGVRGERWHGVLVTRALDPDVRPRGEAPPQEAPDDVRVVAPVPAAPDEDDTQRTRITRLR